MKELIGEVKRIIDINSKVSDEFEQEGDIELSKYYLGKKSAYSEVLAHLEKIQKKEPKY